MLGVDREALEESLSTVATGDRVGLQRSATSSAAAVSRGGVAHVADGCRVERPTCAEGRVVDHWIRHVRDIAKFYKDEIERETTAAAQSRRLCELNVAVQVVHVRESPILLAARNRGVKVHGWIYDVADGLLRDLTPMVDEVRALEPSCRLQS